MIEEIDSVVGPRGRSAFLVETARAELRRRRLLAFLRGDTPAWSQKNQPDMEAGSGAWVQRLRMESENQVSRLGRPKKPKK